MMVVAVAEAQPVLQAMAVTDRELLVLTVCTVQDKLLRQAVVLVALELRPTHLDHQPLTTDLPEAVVAEAV